MEGFFLDSSVDALQQITGTHNSWLVALSILVAVFSASMALQTTHIARASDLPLHRQIAIGTGSFALGGGMVQQLAHRDEWHGGCPGLGVKNRKGRARGRSGDAGATPETAL